MENDKKRKSETEMENDAETKIQKSEESEPEFDRDRRIRELRDDLFREADEYVRDFPSSRIAIFYAPPSSNFSMHTFGYPSVEEGTVPPSLEDKSSVSETEEAKENDNDDDDDVEEEEEEENDVEVEEEVERPRRRFWWEDMNLYKSMNPEELKASLDVLKRMRDDLILRSEAKKRAQGSENQKDEQDGPKV